ncbi:MAG TPA: VWA domain-containing protein [Pyrinomonadaceae bacterium]|nr:VWA domain-containing protein [Pyrinomonadaceae bacterium]
MRFRAAVFLISMIMVAVSVAAQSGRTKSYSESRATTQRAKSVAAPNVGTAGNTGQTSAPASKTAGSAEQPELEVIKIETDLVIVPFRVTDKSGRTITNIRQDEVKIFEGGEERDIAWFSDLDQPFTVALVLDMSYSSVFKLKDIQDAAKKFVSLLRPADRVMVISFAERPIVLCEATGDRRVLNMAIEGAKIESGTGLYRTLDMVLNQKLRPIDGRKAVVLLSDGVDTSSKLETAATVGKDTVESDALIFPIRYNTFDDVQKNRRNTAPIQYDDNDRPYTVETRQSKGEREEDYAFAKEFLQTIAQDTGGRMYNVSSTTNLDEAFANIANELRKIYSLGYYPSSERESGASFDIKVRVYRPDLNIRTKERFTGR